MSKWYEGVLELNNIKELTMAGDTIRVKLPVSDFDYYNKYFNDYIVFRYLYIVLKDVTIFKNCFIITIHQEIDDCVISFNCGECKR